MNLEASKKAANLKSASKEPGRSKVAKITKAQVKEIAEKKMKYCSYLVFPEGTRSRDGHVGKFKSGALILTEKGCKILPVALIGPEKILKTGEINVHPGEVRIKIFPPTMIGENESRQELAERLHDLISDYIESEKS